MVTYSNSSQKPTYTFNDDNTEAFVQARLIAK
jgi:hypothetical protein